MGRRDYPINTHGAEHISHDARYAIFDGVCRHSERCLLKMTQQEAEILAGHPTSVFWVHHSPRILEHADVRGTNLLANDIVGISCLDKFAD